ncbi:MAG: FKBP-type peptidyl-prolyl cis-trans isomerase [Clostridia bacterium]|nr:FKBP-type peptidyl-prolyl cis-trans isomerase [Clostridia bacterium]
MKNISANIKKNIVISIIIIILLSIIIAAPGCSKKETLKTYATEDTSYILKLADYRNLKLKKDISVSDDEINDTFLKAISDMSSRNDFSADPVVIDPSFAKLTALVSEDAVTKNGDFICFDYSGVLDDKPLSGGVASYQFTWLGSGNFIPGFEEGIVGHTAGETFSITVTFPSSYPQNTDLENKEVVFNITVRYILPGITDESIGVLNEYNKIVFDESKVKDDDVFKPSYANAEEYRTYVKSKLRADKETSFSNNLEGLIMEQLYKTSEFGEVPQDRIDSFKKSVEDIAAMYGVSTEIYLYYAYAGMSISQFDELARFQVCARGIFSAIIKAEKMNISESEFKEKAAIIAKNYEYESVDALIEAAGKENVYNSIYTDKVLTLLKECVTFEVIE